MEKHLTYLGYLYIGLNLLSIAIALFFWFTKDAFFLPVAIIIFSLPGLLVGYGLLKRYSWARVLAVVMGILNLFSIPIGTAIGIYAIWVLFNDKTRAIFVNRGIST